ncbi:unnamed protein product, partial [Heterotrigona itama]
INTNDTQRHLKDLQHIDQSLRTVATQLLNVTNPEDPPKILDNVIKKSTASQKPVERNEAVPIKEINVNNAPPVNVGFGRPINSKFSYFETSHPGQAMAITEEELERELSSTRLMTAYKNHPTTTGGISTWILLNPPSTTLKTMEIEKKTKQPMEMDVKVTDAKPTTLMERIDTTERVAEKVTVPVSTTLITDEPSTTKKPVSTTKKTIESKPEKIQSTENVYSESIQSTTLKAPHITVNNSETKETVISTTKKVQIVRTTPKPKTTTTKTTVLLKHSVTKPSRPQHQNRPKPPMRRTTTVKPDTIKNETVSAGKIEKVTFRPVQIITIPKSKVESTEKPMFVTKIKASIIMDTQKTTTQSSVSSTTSLEVITTPKPTTIGNNLEVSAKPKPVGTKVNNVLKVQLKRPLDEATTRIEVESVKANAAALKVEKVEKNEVKEEAEKELESLDNTRIDLMQFDFNPELTKINVNTEVSPTSSTIPSTTSTSTTKRPRNNSKRKKNKNRRRKPTTSTTMTTISSATSSTIENDLAEESVAENGIQESKIVPETKVASNWTKTKKKPAPTPISMQIYNFLSREVMPSFGVMSLVGLGLGLASYFLYPLGGTVTRRNYEDEPKYKYNFDEYGGNYGQSEEEVLSKVLQGMTTDESKYPGGSKDHDSNYYRYQQYDGNYDTQPIKKSDQRYPSSSPMYRPESTASVHKYRNTDYRYTQSTSTSNYYDRPKHREYVVGSVLPSTANRQFVVGSVPKEYPPYADNLAALSTTGKLVNSYEPTEESGQIQFNHDINQSFNFPVGSVQSYGQVQTARPDETYEEVEITPTAVAVEHGPRSLKVKRSLQEPTEAPSTKARHSRRRRDSVIQIIPSKRELEEGEKEEDLSNEILNIIDSAIPEEDYAKEKKKDKETEDFESQRRKEKEDEKNRLKETDKTTVKSQTLKTSTATFVDISTATKETTDSSSSSSFPSSSSTESVSSEDTTTNSPKTTESTIEWTDATTKKPAEQNGFNLFNFVKRIAEIKFRLGLTLLKHASEGFARYLGHVQKRINGEE